MCALTARRQYRKSRRCDAENSVSSEGGTTNRVIFFERQLRPASFVVLKLALHDLTEASTINNDDVSKHSR